MAFYRVTFALEHDIEADSEEDALAEAEEQLARDFEQPHVGFFDLMEEPKIEVLERSNYVHHLPSTE